MKIYTSPRRRRGEGTAERSSGVGGQSRLAGSQGLGGGHAGGADGRVELTIPILEGRHLLAGANGGIGVKAENGSLGQQGLIGMLITVIRTTETFRLRAPSLRDQGLSFDTCEGRLTLTQGVGALDRLKVATPSFELRGGGTVSFAQEEMDLYFLFNILETVTGLTRRVPVLRDLASAVGKIGDVPITMKGDLYNPTTSVAPGSRIRRLLTPSRSSSQNP